jgi:hypothetical protein
MRVCKILYNFLLDSNCLPRAASISSRETNKQKKKKEHRTFVPHNNSQEEKLATNEGMKKEIEIEKI